MRYLVFFLVIFFMLPCCTSKETSGILSPEVRYMSDTMFSKRKAQIIIDLDSLCAKQFDDLVDQAKDSLYKIEISRIEELSTPRRR